MIQRRSSVQNDIFLHNTTPDFCNTISCQALGNSHFPVLKNSPIVFLPEDYLCAQKDIREQLAELLRTKKATISAYENDRIDIKSSIVLEIAKALGCTGSYLLEGNGVITIDDRIATILSGIKSNYVKEIALKQIQVLTEIETDHSNK